MGVYMNSLHANMSRRGAHLQRKRIQVGMLCCLKLLLQLLKVATAAACAASAAACATATCLQKWRRSGHLYHDRAYHADDAGAVTPKPPQTSTASPPRTRATSSSAALHHSPLPSPLAWAMRLLIFLTSNCLAFLRALWITLSWWCSHRARAASLQARMGKGINM